MPVENAGLPQRLFYICIAISHKWESLGNAKKNLCEKEEKQAVKSRRLHFMRTADKRRCFDELVIASSMSFRPKRNEVECTGEIPRLALTSVLSDTLEIPRLRSEWQVKVYFIIENIKMQGSLGRVSGLSSLTRTDETPTPHSWPKKYDGFLAIVFFLVKLPLIIRTLFILSKVVSVL